MEMAKVTSKGQITIPVSIRRRLKISEGDRLLFIDRPEGVVMVNPDMLPGGKAAETGQDARPLPHNAVASSEAQNAAGAGRPDATPAQPTQPTTPAQPNQPAQQTQPTQPATPAQPETSAYPPDATHAPSAQPAQPAQPENETGRQGEKLQGLDLSSLLNEIRSIGSNI